ncbi:hypothetical protein [Amycolatopsis sp. cmx-4-68]|uniref:hypothetical protein n=1 Tax=Amycolatopsis sp. cmx-4-68 TaxID=2790938 RepID=UPI0039789747
MRLTRIGGPAAVVMCASGLALAAPEVAAAAPAAPVTSRATERPADCLSGVYRLQVRGRHTPLRTVYAVQSTWVPFTCVKGDLAKQGHTNG